MDAGPKEETGDKGNDKGQGKEASGGAAAATSTASDGSGDAKEGSKGEDKESPDAEESKKKFAEEGDASKLKLPSIGSIVQQVQSCSLSGNQQRNTWMVLGAGIVFPSLLVGFAAVVAVGLKPVRWAWYAAGMLLATATVFVAVRMYFGLLELRLAQVVLYILATSLHLAAHVPVMIEYGSQNSDGVEGADTALLGVLFAFFLYPALIISLVAAYKWSDEEWQLPPVHGEGVLFNLFACLRPRGRKPPAATPAASSAEGAGDDADASGGGVARSDAAKRRDELKAEKQREKAASATFVYLCLLVSQLVIIGFIAASNAVFGNIAVTLGVLVAYLFGLAVACTVVYALANNGYLPPAVSYTFAGIVMFFVVAGILVGTILYVRDGQFSVVMACVSASWWLVAALLLGYGTLSLLRAGVFGGDPFKTPEDAFGGGIASDGPLIFSPFVLPAYRHDLQADELVEDNLPVVTIMAGLSMGVAWGLVFAMVVSPAYLGVMAAVICTCLGVLAALHVVRRTESMVDEACELVDEEHARIVRKRMVASAGAAQGTMSRGPEQGSGSLRVLMREAVMQWSGALEAAGETSSRG